MGIPEREYTQEETLRRFAANDEDLPLYPAALQHFDLDPKDRSGVRDIQIPADVVPGTGAYVWFELQQEDVDGGKKAHERSATQSEHEAAHKEQRHTEAEADMLAHVLNTHREELLHDGLEESEVQHRINTLSVKDAAHLVEERVLQHYRALMQHGETTADMLGRADPHNTKYPLVDLLSAAEDLHHRLTT